MVQHRRRPLPHGVRGMIDDLLSNFRLMREILDETEADISEQDMQSLRLRISETKVLIGDSKERVQELTKGREDEKASRAIEKEQGMFILDNDGDYRNHNGENPTIVRALPAGVYQVMTSMDGRVFFRPVTTTGDVLIKLDTSVARQVRQEIALFFDGAITTRLAGAGIRHRRGILLHGAPGTGKTSLVRALFPYILEQNAVILVETNADHLENLVIPAIRQHDPDRPVVLVWDEFEKNAKYSRTELLRLLDGLSSPDHILTIGTTNFLGQIPDQLKNRPSRFGLILEMPLLGTEARLSYIDRKYPMLDVETSFDLVELTGSMPLDYLEEACKLSLMGYHTDEIRDRVRGPEHSVLVISEDDDEGDDL